MFILNWPLSLLRTKLTTPFEDRPRYFVGYFPSVLRFVEQHKLKEKSVAYNFFFEVLSNTLSIFSDLYRLP